MAELNGDFPLYEHVFSNFTPTEFKTIPPKAYLYYYINEVPNYPEVTCKKKGCWIISKSKSERVKHEHG